MTKRKELLQTIADIENGLAMNPTGEILERLTNRLQRAKDQLAKLDEQQKKSIQQVESPKAELPKPNPLREVKPAVVPKQDSPVQRFFQTVAAVVAPPPIPESYVTVQLVSGESVDMGLNELRSQARKYFTQLVDGAAMKDGNYNKVMASAQYRNLCAFVAGMQALQDEQRPTVEDLHIRHWQHGDNVKSRANKLLELIYQQ